MCTITHTVSKMCLTLIDEFIHEGLNLGLRPSGLSLGLGLGLLGLDYNTDYKSGLPRQSFYVIFNFLFHYIELGEMDICGIPFSPRPRPRLRPEGLRPRLRPS